MQSVADILCIPRLHLRRFRVFGALIFICACADGGCAHRPSAVRSPLALASRARPTESGRSDAAKRLDTEAQRLLKEMQKRSARGARPVDAIPGSVGTGGTIGDVASTATSTIGAGSGTQPPAPANDVAVESAAGSSGQVSGQPDTSVLLASPSSDTALLVSALAALGAVAAAGVTLLMRRRA